MKLREKEILHRWIVSCLTNTLSKNVVLTSFVCHSITMAREILVVSDEAFFEEFKRIIDYDDDNETEMSLFCGMLMVGMNVTLSP
jgi:hypothetical protein